MNPPPIQWLPVFAKAAEHKNFRIAADELNVSPPAVSQQIRSLEDYLGFALFKRNGPRLALTEAGEFYYRSIQPMLNHYQASFDELDRRFNRRSLRLNAPLFIAQELLVPNYMEYKKFQPDTELRITTGTEYIDFNSNIADAAIRFGYGDWPPLEAKPLCDVTTSPICSPDFYEKNLNPKLPLEQMLNNQVLLSTNENYTEWKLLFPSIKPKEIIVCDSYFSVIKSAEKGLGLGLGLFPAINVWINESKLRLISNEQFDTNAGYWLVYPKQRTENQLIDSCYEWAKEVFSSLPELKFKGSDPFDSDPVSSTG